MSNWGRIGVFDLETTGVDVDTSRIVSACVAVLSEHGEVVDRWDWLADPGIEIPEGAAAVHGITTERARAEGREARLVVAEITQTLRVLSGLGMPIVVYNAPYDFTLLDRECRRHQLEVLGTPSAVIDPLVMDKAVDRYRKGKRTLEVTADRYGVDLDDAHDAGSDAIAAGRVAQALARAYPDELDLPLAQLHARQAVWYAEQAESFQRYIRSAKGDESFVAEKDWPLRPVASAISFLDTQPIPAPAPRPSDTVPSFDFGQGLPRAIESSALTLPHRTTTPVEQPSLFDEVLEAPEEVDAFRWPAEEPVPFDEPTIAPEDLDEHVEHVTTAPDETSEPVAIEEDAARESEQSDADDSDLSADVAEDAAEPAGRPVVLRIAAGIITDGLGRTLLVRKRGTTAFMQAGGKIEPGESAFDALARELLEEIGLEVDPDVTEYLGSHRAVAANEPYTVIRAEVFALSTSMELQASAEIEELLWIDDVESDVELAPLTRDTILPLWIARRSSLF